MHSEGFACRSLCLLTSRISWLMAVPWVAGILDAVVVCSETAATWCALVMDRKVLARAAI